MTAAGGFGESEAWLRHSIEYQSYRPYPCPPVPSSSQVQKDDIQPQASNISAMAVSLCLLLSSYAGRAL